MSHKYDQIQQTRSAESIKPQVVLPPSSQFIAINVREDPSVFSTGSRKSVTLSRKSKRVLQGLGNWDLVSSIEKLADFPGETFRVLKEKEGREFGEYRTRRLFFEARNGLGESLNVFD